MNTEPAIFIDGEPANLPAAALDAAEWLDVMSGMKLTSDSAERLSRARAALRRFLVPHLPEEHRNNEAQNI